MALALALAAAAVADGGGCRGVAEGEEWPWLDAMLAPPQRAALVLAKMSQAEKLAMLHGNPSGGTECFNHTTGRIVGAYCAYTGNVAGSERLGIPPLHLNDGPQGFRENTHPGSTTQFPSGLTVAASWDPAVMQRWGAAMGKPPRYRWPSGLHSSQDASDIVADR